MNKNTSNISGIKIELLNDINEVSHFHPEIEIVFVIAGEVCISTKDNYYKLSKEDIILLNSNSAHKIESIGDTAICKIQIAYNVLTNVVNNGNYIFYCNSLYDELNSYDELRNIIKKIVFSYLGHEKKTECLRYGLVFELLDILIECFQKDGEYFKYKNGSKENEQIQYIINYVNLNYQNSISLNELANEMFTSPSTLSRFFKKHYGIYFGDFVNKVRFNYAVKDLLETNKTITKIAIDCGFSNASVFSKNFQSMYGMSPTEYRKVELAKENDRKEKLKFDNEKLIKDISMLQYEDAEIQKISKEVEVEALVSNSYNYKKPWNIVVNAGAAHNLIFANVQSHISYLVEKLKFKYVRIWSIFSKKLMIQRNNNDLNYNFSMIDTILDFLLSLGAKPFIDFGKRPDCAVEAEDKTIFFEEDYIEFNNAKEWHNMFQKFITHIMKRYGKEEVESWKYEFTITVKEDSLYVNDKDSSIEEIFAESFKFLKANLPNAEIGGIGAVMEVNSDKLLHWLEYCKNNNCIPDFVSIIAFPYHPINDGKKAFAKRVTNEDEMINQIKKARVNLDISGFDQCKLYITECNSSLSTRNYLNDSCFRAAYMARVINELEDIPDLIGLWMGSDLVSSYYDTSRIVNGGNGLITKDKINKPVYYALAFLNRLGSKLIQRGKNYIITTNDMNSYYIFCFNYKRYSYDYYLNDENKLDLNDLSSLFENDDNLKLMIDLKGMPEGG